ncbi:hypothetical protein D3C76_760220 [compost metagenome]
MADHTVATPHATLCHRAGARAGQGRMHMLGLHMLAPDITEDTVVGFQHHWHTPIGMQLGHVTLGRHQCITHHADAVGIGVGDWSGQ